MRAAASLILCLSLSLAAWADSPLEQALAVSKDGPAYKFDLDYSGKDMVARMRVDPSLPEGQRLVLVSPGRDDLSDEAQKKFEAMQAKSKGDIWCAAFARNIPANAEMVSETSTTATYGFTPAATKEDGDMGKAYKHLTGRVTVSKERPGILSYRMYAEKPFKPMPVAKIEAFRMDVSCAAAPDGRTYIADVSINLSGSALMQKFTESERQKVSNLVVLPETAAGQR